MDMKRLPTLAVLSEDLLMHDGGAWMRASALARHLGLGMDLVLNRLAIQRYVLGNAWWKRHVRMEGVDRLLSREAVALMPIAPEDTWGMRLKARCLEAFGAEARLRPEPGRPIEHLGGDVCRTDPTADTLRASGGPSGCGPELPLPVPFYGATLYMVTQEGEPYVPMRPVVEGMGLAWHGQFERLNRDAERWGIRMTRIPSSGGVQETVCIPLRKIAGWLMSIEVRRVRPELRDRIRAYQRECDDVLWRYWSRGRVEAAPPATETEPTRSGPFVPDDAFVARLYLALGRKAVQTEVLRRLLAWGALEGWLDLSIRRIAWGGPRLSVAAVQKALRLLRELGVVARAPDAFRYRVLKPALQALLADVAGRPVEPLEQVLAGAPHEEALRLPGSQARRLH